jgi:hypothetical protein
VSGWFQVSGGGQAQPSYFDGTIRVSGAPMFCPLVLLIIRPVALFGSLAKLRTANTAENMIKRQSPPLNTLNRDSAIALAKRIEQYWHDQGYPAGQLLDGAARRTLCQDQHLRGLTGEVQSREWATAPLSW